MSIDVTIYNDDEHGQSFRVMRVNTLTEVPPDVVVQEAGEHSKTQSQGYKLRPGDVLIVTACEKVKED